MAPWAVSPAAGGRGAVSFFEMGGYATYVWPAFGAAAAIMVALLVLSIRTMRAREATLRALEATARQRRAADGDGDSDGEQNAPA